MVVSSGFSSGTCLTVVKIDERRHRAELTMQDDSGRQYTCIADGAPESFVIGSELFTEIINGSDCFSGEFLSVKYWNVVPVFTEEEAAEALDENSILLTERSDRPCVPTRSVEFSNLSDYFSRMRLVVTAHGLRFFDEESDIRIFLDRRVVRETDQVCRKMRQEVCPRYQVAEGAAKIADGSLITTHLRTCSALALFDGSRTFLVHVNQYVEHDLLVSMIQRFVRTSDAPDGIGALYWGGARCSHDELTPSPTTVEIQSALEDAMGWDTEKIREGFKGAIHCELDAVGVKTDGTPIAIHCELQACAAGKTPELFDPGMSPSDFN